jgi:6-pyruvoyltetrahydropterin/6-carboxytetrahydropterin synthase
VTFTIARRFSFAAAHHLVGLPPGHKCAWAHGHTYAVEIRLVGTVLDDAGFLADFAGLDPLKDYLGAELDHRDLNEVLPVQPSCENIARYLYCWCRDNLEYGRLVTAVRVFESPATWAEFAPTSSQVRQETAVWC